MKNVNVSKLQDDNLGSWNRDGMRTEPDSRDGRCRAPIGNNDQGETKGDSAGEDDGSVVGCNANTWNPQASLRTANCNNHAGNGNDNYAGAFAVDKGIEENGKHLSAQPTRLNNKESHAVTDVHGQCDYSSLPFMEGGEEESNAELPIREKLRIANSGRKLKNLRCFFLSREIIEAGFDRCLRHAAKTDETRWYARHKKRVCDRIHRELEQKTYEPKPCVTRTIHKPGKGDKDREATIYDVYDRIIHNIILVVIEEKVRRCFIRNIYSGIDGRGMFANDRRFCMVNRIRHYVATHQDDYVELTDIRHFYQTLRMEVALRRLFRIIVCPYTRWLIGKAFSKTEFVPIGGSLSQMMAMLTILDGDKEVLRRWKVSLFCFGDNRLIGGKRDDVLAARDYLRDYYKSLGLEMKDDYQLRKVRDGFMFCKYHYYKSWVRPRAELRRRAIRAYGRGMEHYSGYHGILMKCDAKHLKNLIENLYMELRNKKGMKIPDMIGSKLKLRDLPDNTRVLVSSCKRVNNNKESGFYYAIQYIQKDPITGAKSVHVSSEGSMEIKEFGRLVDEGAVSLPLPLTVMHDGKSSYFKEFHTTEQEACEAILASAEGIDF